MLNRVTSQTMATTAQQNLQANMGRMAKLQDQAASLKNISRPSDNPVGTADSMRVRSDQAAANQHSRNIDDGNGWLTIIDSTLAASVDLINRAKDLTLQGANGSMSQPARDAIAAEISGLKDDILKQANSSYLGRSVFAGNSDAGVAFKDDLSFTGAAGSTVQRRVGPGETIRVDADGAALFGTGADSVFALLDKVAADLRSGAAQTGNIAALDERLQTVIAGQAEVGSRHARLLRAGEMNKDLSNALEGQRMGIEDADLPKLIMDLKVQEVNYQAALSVTAKALQPSLMDFLR